jgi:glucose-1-phosphate adenylyltransferase
LRSSSAAGRARVCSRSPKNARIGDGARLVNEGRVDRADGDGYYIRNGIIIVPKDGVIKPGTRI